MHAVLRKPTLCVSLCGLLTACPSGVATIPSSCAEGQILVRSAGQWECGWPPALFLPGSSNVCLDKDGKVSTRIVLTSDGTRLTCSEVDYGVGATLQLTTTNAKKYHDKAVLRLAAEAGAPDLYRGVTSARSTGLMQKPGVLSGLPAAAAICAAEYAGSHLCSMLELHDSVAYGKLTPETQIPKAWIYFPAGNASPAALQPTEGLADSCASYTYDRNDRGWSGIAVEWTTLDSGYVGFKFNGGSSATCDSLLPLACCGGAT